MKQLSFLFAVWVLMVMGQVGDGYGSEAMVGCLCGLWVSW
jgi:hypothetical protein